MLTEEKVGDLYRKASTELPSDVVRGLETAKGNEKGRAKEILGKILENVSLARRGSRPICQDTGTPVFYVKRDAKQSESEIRGIIERATAKATSSIPLRHNAVDSVPGIVSGNSPLIHFEESDSFGIDLLMKGGGSENVSRIYSLPDSELKAKRDLGGVRKCILDSIVKAQGKACPPYILGVALGGSLEEVAHLSKKQLLRDLNDVNGDSELEKFEKETLQEINKLGIGPSGLGGETTALAVKVTKSPRHPASFFVGIAFGCWALRRAGYG
jgi:fumarate hydratase class I